ncbi:Fc.00g079930.m01.CDS01 [Cosmosporella sp. VM-42]
MHGGNQTTAFELAKKMLSSRHTRVSSDRRYYRTEKFVQDNQAFISRLGEIKFEGITVASHPEDLVLWRALAVLFIQNFDIVKYWTGLRTIVGLYGRAKSEQAGLVGPSMLTVESDDVLDPQLLASFQRAIGVQNAMGSDHHKNRRRVLVGDIPVLHCTREGGLQQELASYKEFLHGESELFVQADREPVGDQDFVPGLVKTKLEVTRDRYNFIKMDRFEMMSLAFEQRTHDQAISSPSAFLRFIDWNELEPRSFHESEATMDAIGLEQFAFSEPELKLWAKPDSTSSSNVLYISEDLYCHHIIDGYKYPGLLLDGGILFRCRELEQTPFAPEMGRFCRPKSDIAVTQEPESGKFFLSDSGPMSFFGLKWRNRNKLDRQRRELEGVLGRQFRPPYCDFLVYVETSEFEMEKALLIGEGSFGKIHRIPWKNKLVEVSLEYVEEQLGDVAIKVARARSSNAFELEAKFFAELATSYQALAGNAALAGFVQFFGITKVSIDPRTDEICRSNAENSQPKETRLALVFDYADGGTLLDYLFEKLTKDDPYES